MRFILTRPMEDSLHLGSLMENLHHDVLIDPMLEIEFIKNDFDIKEINCFIITSRYAAHSLLKIHNINKLKNKIFFCIGIATRNILINYGFKNIHHANGTSEDLLEIITSHSIKNNKFLYIRGADINCDICKILNNFGISTSEEIVYKANSATALLMETVTAINNNTIDGIIFYSKRTAEIFINLIKINKLSNKTSIICAYCLSEEIADILRAFNMKVKVAKYPMNDDIINLIN
ncbi:uroporphyrinogen-III synthase [Hyphomicrobiales bacterium]|jgi:uroporphyrinogen-III synthase|nr:uroporphyrinogen-III synthase [Rhodobiaceae bacterium]MBT6223408.1 uroporphyrinogen-III synthase [Rhodobiaceae bacterium]MDB4128108.1 uroporphyrinogen-III synthase [Hyphomicrobiales bacterium]MDB4831134.1 uroporphyrinogen-III synthase [Hyphomicrobiales bacterium]MDC3272070.1 uroporphyrinogen-III synthase [Hyphomicrobiales bacterium]|tara:strand:- start:1101 stop:1802 length:702 start_codon:yes stop_codon:yes gene_type:complete